MFEEIKNIKAGKKELISFGYTIEIILLFVVAILFYYNNLIYQNLAIVALVLIILAVIDPILLKPIYLVWMIFAVILGWIMTRVILSLVFYVIMTPISLITRLLGEDFLALKKNDSDSYWNHRVSDYETNQDYEKQF
tara:strand:+ start:2954 stop:3364 length:411 start_codon:yes stop_codon:yes gene_type:complete